MPHPFSPEDFPIDEDREFNPTKTFYLKGTIHFKNDASILDLTGKIRRHFDDFSNPFMQSVEKVVDKMKDEQPKYSFASSGNMMRTLKTMKNSKGDKVCDLNMTFVSFDNSSVRFPSGSEHCRHEIELAPVGDGKTEKHECFIRHSIPYFWDMTNGEYGTLYKCINQKQVEIGMVTGFGFKKDAVMVLDGDELDEVVALSTCVMLLNGRDAIDY
ncbi:hypothetical protein JX265_007879 [Neoarthrinium moseri]|uniref:Uncharacterized protein n=1 Tax=Neoarthrinium moseri TaxID=1658444 RepID=A0A9P9WJN5_9PEZI|nr:hypothetical protein JX265_007879 [Neoarthrinium moseri]